MVVWAMMLMVGVRCLLLFCRYLAELRMPPVGLLNESGLVFFDPVSHAWRVNATHVIPSQVGRLWC